MSHTEISSKIENLVNNPATIHTLEKKYNINKNFVDIPYAPIIQSGGKYDLRSFNIFLHTDGKNNIIVKKDQMQKVMEIY